MNLGGWKCHDRETEVVGLQHRRRRRASPFFLPILFLLSHLTASTITEISILFEKQLSVTVLDTHLVQYQILFWKMQNKETRKELHIHLLIFPPKRVKMSFYQTAILSSIDKWILPSKN